MNYFKICTLYLSAFALQASQFETKEVLSGVVSEAKEMATETKEGVMGLYSDIFSDWFESDDPDFEKFMGLNFTGGGLRKKSEVTIVDPIHLTLPTFDSNGCDFNFNMGGVNFVSGDQIKDALKVFGKNAKSTLLILAFESTTPMMSSVIKKLNDWAVHINGQSLNTCQLAKDAGRSLSGYLSEKRKSLCKEQRNSSGKATSFLETFFQCGNLSESEVITLSNSKEAKEALLGEFDLTGKIISESIVTDPLLRNMESLVASMFGTIQSKQTEQESTISATNAEGKTVKTSEKKFKYIFSYLSPKFDEVWQVLCPDQPSFFQKIWKGEAVLKSIAIKNGYIYEDGKVRNIENNEKVEVPSLLAQSSEIAATLTSIIRKLHNEGLSDKEEEFTDREKQLFTYTNFPLGDFCIHLARNKSIEANCSVEELSKFLVVQRLSGIFETIFSRMKNGLQKIDIGKENAVIVDSYKKQLDEVFRKFASLKEKSNHGLKALLEFQEMLTRVTTNKSFSEGE